MRRKSWLYLAGFSLLALFLNIHVSPLFYEEPRRALIALEMSLTKDFLIPTEYGIPYCKKGPLYTWILLLSSEIFGGYTEFSVRFFSVLSHILIGVAIWKFAARFYSERIAWISALGYLLSVDILFYFSLTGEIDLFYSFLHVLLFFAPYWAYRRGHSWWLYIAPWLLAVLGVMTKGAPSVIALGLTLIAFHLVYLRSWKSLFHWKQWVAGILSVAALLLYVALYAQKGSLSCWIGLYSQASDRSLWSYSIVELIRHFIDFPLMMLKICLPLSPLLFLLFSKKLRSQLWAHPTSRYLLVVLGLNIIIYALSPGTRSRYVYMFIPVIVILCAHLWSMGSTSWMQKIYRGITWLIAGGLLVGVCIPWVSSLDYLPDRLWIGALSILLGLILTYLLYSRRTGPLYSLFLGLVLCRFMFSLIVPPARAYRPEALAHEYKKDAMKILDIVQDRDLAIYDDTHFCMATSFYLVRGRQQLLTRETTATPGGYLMVQDKYLSQFDTESLYQFQYEGKTNHLILID